MAARRRATRDTLTKLRGEIEQCRACPRLVRWRESVAVERRAAYRDEKYWGKPIAGFGDPDARIVVLGLAPGAHGANRTGRVFTGDRSGDWLYRAMHRAGLASQATSTGRADGLTLSDAWVTVAVRCAPPDNKPLPLERKRCSGFLTRELALLRNKRVVVCLGNFAYVAACDFFSVSPRPKFAHGAIGNDMNKSNVPDERLRFREKNLKEERDFFFRCKKMYNDAKVARRAAAPQNLVPPAPQIRFGSPVNESAANVLSFGSLARHKSVATHHASGKSSPMRTASSPKKFAPLPPVPS